VTAADAPPVDSSGDEVEPRVLELFAARETQVGTMRVRRALPRRARRTVGAWCFADHMGPAAVTEERGIDIGPHPHMGLQTVTWLVAGEILHRDSLGSEQIIRAGQLNLMTAGNGVAHSEEATGQYRGTLHGIQLWVAQPETTRHGPPTFEHYDVLPAVELDGCTATVVVGDFAGSLSPAHRDSDHVGVDLALRTRRTVAPVRPDYEYALIVLDGEVEVGSRLVEPGRLAYLGTGRSEIVLDARASARVMLLGGVPFPEHLLMWWNFVARTTDEVDAAAVSWNGHDRRFGVVDSPLQRIPAPRTSWTSDR
jgi:quercetin 2,3-dioxygenase